MPDYAVTHSAGATRAYTVQSQAIADDHQYAVAQGGPDGSSRPQRHIHQQPTPATVWIVDHALGRRPIVAVYDTTGREILADVTAPDASRVVITHALPTDGEAHLT